MLSPCGKNACYTTTCDHLNDLNSNAINGKSAIAGGNSSNSSGSIASGDQVDTAQVSQTSAVTAAFQQASGTTAQHPQLQSVPAGAMTILVRGANSHSALQVGLFFSDKLPPSGSLHRALLRNLLLGNKIY